MQVDPIVIKMANRDPAMSYWIVNGGGRTSHRLPCVLGWAIEAGRCRKTESIAGRSTNEGGMWALTALSCKTAAAPAACNQSFLQPRGHTGGEPKRNQNAQHTRDNWYPNLLLAKWLRIRQLQCFFLLTEAKNETS